MSAAKLVAIASLKKKIQEESIRCHTTTGMILLDYGLTSIEGLDQLSVGELLEIESDLGKVQLSLLEAV